MSQGKESLDILKAEAFRNMNLIQTVIKIKMAKGFEITQIEHSKIISGLSNQYQEKLSDQTHEIQRFKNFG